MPKLISDPFLPRALWRHLQSLCSPEYPAEQLRQACLQTVGRVLWPPALPQPAWLSATVTLPPAQAQALCSWLFEVPDLWMQMQRLALLSELLADRKQRKQTGVYYTPPLLAHFLAAESLGPLWQGPAKVLQCLDPACGSGLFLWAIFQQVWERGLKTLSDRQTRQQLSFDWISALQGCDLDPLALEVTRLGFICFWAQTFPDTPFPEPRLLCADALAADPQQSDALILERWLQAPLDLILANPPYLGEKNHQAVFAALREGLWMSDYRGRGDLYYYFFYLALRLAKPQTVLGLLTPSYFLSATAATHLRCRLQYESTLLQLIDFQSLRLFPGALGQHNAFTLLRCAPPPSQHQVKLRQVARPGQLCAQDLLDLQAQVPVLKAQQALFQGKSALMLSQADTQLEARLHHLEQISEPLGSSFEVAQGIVSGADKLSARHQAHYAIPQAVGSGIFVLNLTEAEALAQRLEQCGLKPEHWLRPWFKSSDIEAFSARNTARYRLLYLHRNIDTLPDVLKHQLRPFYPLLCQRREVRQGRLPWWQLQWPRRPELFTQPKLVLPQRSEKVRAARVDGAWYASADVYFIQAREQTQRWSLDLLLLWLNSAWVSEWFYHRGKRKGQLLELYQKPLSQIPLPRLSAEQQACLNQWDTKALPSQALHAKLAEVLALKPI